MDLSEGAGVVKVSCGNYGCGTLRGPDAGHPRLVGPGEESVNPRRRAVLPGRPVDWSNRAMQPGLWRTSEKATSGQPMNEKLQFATSSVTKS
jgi:hypothetical protein